METCLTTIIEDTSFCLSPLPGTSPLLSSPPDTPQKLPPRVNLICTWQVVVNILLAVIHSEQVKGITVAILSAYQHGGEGSLGRCGARARLTSGPWMSPSRMPTWKDPRAKDAHTLVLRVRKQPQKTWGMALATLWAEAETRLEASAFLPSASSLS